MCILVIFWWYLNKLLRVGFRIILSWRFNASYMKIALEKNHTNDFEKEKLGVFGLLIIILSNRSISWFSMVNFSSWNLKMNWQQGYAPTNSDRREGVLRRKRLEYLDCVSQYYDIPDTERSDDEISMLRQVSLIMSLLIIDENKYFFFLTFTFYVC